MWKKIPPHIGKCYTYNLVKFEIQNIQFMQRTTSSFLP